MSATEIALGDTDIDLFVGRGVDTDIPGLDFIEVPLVVMDLTGDTLGECIFAEVDVVTGINIFGLVSIEVAIVVTDTPPLLPIYTGDLAGEFVTGLVLTNDALSLVGPHPSQLETTA